MKSSRASGIAATILCVFVGVVFLTPLASGANSLPAWVGKNCSSRFDCVSDAALCIDGQCTLCNGFGDSSCEQAVDNTRKCLPIDDSRSILECSTTYINGSSSAICTCRHKPLLYRLNMDVLDIVGSLLIFLFGSLAAGGGIGGGGVFVPLLILIIRFNAREAIPLSNLLILGSGVANFAQLVGKKIPGSDPPKPVIDYSMALALQPSSMAGTIVGIILNAIFPDWLILALLVITLGVSVWRSSLKGAALCKAERAAQKKAQLQEVQSQTDGEPTSAVSPQLRAFLEDETYFPYFKFLVLLLALGVVLVHTLILGTPSRPSLVSVQICSPTYYGVLMAVFPVFAIMILLIAWRLMRHDTKKLALGYVKGATEFVWTKSHVAIISAVSFTSGILAALLGIGGGMVLSPLMLELNMHPESVAGTSTFMILFTSASSTIQFAIANRILWDYGVLFLIIGLFTSAFGQTMLNVVVAKYGRRSVIIWIIVGIIILSAILLVVVGAIDLRNRLELRGSIGFKTFCP